jgi:hypothetical protein
MQINSESGMMRKRDIILAGACTGTLAATFIIIVFVLAEIDPGSFAGLCGGFFVLAAVSAAIVNKISKQAGWPDVPLKTLIPVGFLTTIMPLFGATFGLPNSGLTSLATLVALGAVGGAFWSLPFVLGAHFKKTDSSQTTTSPPPSSIVVKNITIKDSVVMGDVSNDEE